MADAITPERLAWIAEALTRLRDDDVDQLEDDYEARIAGEKKLYRLETALDRAGARGDAAKVRAWVFDIPDRARPQVAATVKGAVKAEAERRRAAARAAEEEAATRITPGDVQDVTEPGLRMLRALLVGSIVTPRERLAVIRLIEAARSSSLMDLWGVWSKLSHAPDERADRMVKEAAAAVADKLAGPRGAAAGRKRRRR